MKKIVFIGDSITDMKRDRENINLPFAYGYSHVFFTEGYLAENYPNSYQVVNKGVAGSKIIDLLNRLDSDVINENPDYVVILDGVNDIWHKISINSGIDLDTYLNTFKIIIDRIKKLLGDTKIIIMEPFFLKGMETNNYIKEFNELFSYTKELEKLCLDYNINYIKLQDVFTKLGKENGNEYYLYDGIHPTACASKIISSKFLEVFLKLENL